MNITQIFAPLSLIIGLFNYNNDNMLVVFNLRGSTNSSYIDNYYDDDYYFYDDFYYENDYELY